jgi:hypothetical protein
MVRCARCSNDWMAVAEPTTPELPDEAVEPQIRVASTPELPVHELPVHEPPDREVDELPSEPEVFGDTPLSAIERLAVSADLSPRILRRDNLLTAAWAASFAILTVLGVAGYTERDVLMRQWPASKRVYATLGLVRLDMKSRDVTGTDATPAH